MSREIVYLRDDEVGFLNVDVDVFSRTPLDPLTAALGKRSWSTTSDEKGADIRRISLSMTPVALTSQSADSRG